MKDSWEAPKEEEGLGYREKTTFFCMKEKERTPKRSGGGRRRERP